MAGPGETLLSMFSPQAMAAAGASMAQAEHARAVLPYVAPAAAAELSQTQLNLEMQKQAIRDNDAIRDAFKNAGPSIAEKRDYMLRNKQFPISGNGFVRAMTALTDMQAKWIGLDEKTQQLQAQKTGNAGDILEAINGIKDPEKQSQAIQEQRPQLAQLMPQVDWGHLNGDTVDYYLGIARHIGALGVHEKAAAETAASRAEAGLRESEQRKHTAEAEELETQNKLFREQLQQGADVGANAIDQAFPAGLDKDTNISYKAAQRAALLSGTKGGREAAARVVEAAANHAAEIRKGSNPMVLAGEQAKARALLPLEVAKSVAVQRALNSAGNAALRDVPPHLVPLVTRDISAATKEYADAQGQAEEMKAIIDSARAGNVTSYAYAPATGVLAVNTANGIKRINMAEIKQYGRAGSAVDRIEGWFGKQLTGASIAPRVLNDMEAFHGALANVAASKMRQKVALANSTYGGHFDAGELIEAATGAATSAKPTSAGTIRARDPQGKLHEAAAGTPLPPGWKIER